MYRNIKAVVLGAAALLLTVTGCGSPEVPAPDSLGYVHRTHDGARDVPLDATPKVYFNGDVDSASVTAASVYLESATLNWNVEEEQGACEGDWLPVAGQASVDGAMVTLMPDADLADTTCYRMTCTTALRGTELGPMQAQPCNPDEMDACRRDVGVEQTFWTIIVVD
jgi:hypothetical protein